MKLQDFKAFITRITPDLTDFLGFLGFSSLFFGLYLAYPPAAFAVSGGILMGLAFYKARK